MRKKKNTELKFFSKDKPISFSCTNLIKKNTSRSLISILLLKKSSIYIHLKFLINIFSFLFIFSISFLFIVFYQMVGIMREREKREKAIIPFSSTLVYTFSLSQKNNNFFSHSLLHLFRYLKLHTHLLLKRFFFLFTSVGAEREDGKAIYPQPV
jgi:hypothetical protein